MLVLGNKPSAVVQESHANILGMAGNRRQLESIYSEVQRCVTKLATGTPDKAVVERALLELFERGKPSVCSDYYPIVADRTTEARVAQLRSSYEGIVQSARSPVIKATLMVLYDAAQLSKGPLGIHGSDDQVAKATNRIAALLGDVLDKR